MVFVAMLVAAPVAHAEEAQDTVEFGCGTVTVQYTGFPNLPGNTVTEKVIVDGVTIYNGKFKFDGPEATHVIKLHIPPGSHSMDVFVKWKTNGVKGGRDQKLKGGITCDPEPGMEIAKEQRLGTKGPYTSATLPVAHVGETVYYSIVVTNSGNVPETVEPLSDPNCDPGTIMGGPGANPLAPGESTTFTCSHVLTQADLEATVRCNTATATVTPQESEAITHESNTVCVELPEPTFTQEPTCESLTIYYSGFPNVPNITVQEKVKVDGKVVYEGTFTFNGPSATHTFPVVLGPGHHSYDVFSKWSIAGFKGGFDHKVKMGVTCGPPEPAFTIQKLQRIEGEPNYTTELLSSPAGNAVEYEIVIHNTGNTPLTFSALNDPNCDEGTIAGGPGASPVAPSGSTTFTCSHLLSEADAEAGGYENTASDTATPPAGDGAPFGETSNTVLVSVTSVH